MSALKAAIKALKEKFNKDPYRTRGTRDFEEIELLKEQLNILIDYISAQEKMIFELTKRVETIETISQPKKKSHKNCSLAD